MANRIQDLLTRMSLREKIGQMTQLAIDAIAVGRPYRLEDPLELDPHKLQEAIVTYGVGSILNVGTQAHSVERWRGILAVIQKAAGQTRHRIPVLYGIDSVHGANYVAGSTVFPQQLALASTWNPERVNQLAQIAAYETRAAGIPWNFSPVLNLGRHPAWPRLWETFGEDVHLVGELGLAMKRGYEGDDISHPYRLASCPKHFLGGGWPLTGQDRTPSWIPDSQLREYFLPAFARAIADGASTIMVNSGEINGIPVHANREILTTLLREELGFEGLVVTDWEDIRYLHTRHRIAASHKEAVRMAVEAGIDMSMVPLDFSFSDCLLELVEEGTIPEARIDVSVRRILQLKESLGLFDQAVYPLEEYPDFGSAAHRNASLEAARESIVLLKNEQSVLPLRKDQKILVAGPAAHTLRSLNGGWTYTWQGDQIDELLDKKEYPTVLNAVAGRMPEGQVYYAPGVDFEERIDIPYAVRAAAEVDVILLCLGEASYTEFFGSIDDLYLPDAQHALAYALLNTGKPLVLLLLEGRPRLISKFADQVPAILAAFYPGNEGGRAIADVLFGDYNPGGKLPITYPRYPNGLIPYDHKATESMPLQESGVRYNPQFEFGHGLSYTTFAYHNLSLNTPELTAHNLLVISVEVQNTGDRAGHETVQLYVSDHYASLTPPVRRLRGFKKVFLEPGALTRVEFAIRARDLAFVDQNGEWITEAGSFTAGIGGLTVDFNYSA
ncbi:glycoside hydrolase family 3 N-terminal domain-containing protein [Flavilitoribacter nigricans]|uniref:beta-glucosidase n=1 Tax=Flavilitoribacter nigricans (strain ATCC 23147 / DSM 23189 / NBRC 102662 / NCIMB 1420 / SS-2) TaxID=1122177 RepID=A0A2D0MYV6_FLAN2|nr:glycoside hydrolase family 3 N-terminal domain-containing protein [Flavilitoribacter nigricans]PHN01435.1 beta-glucosidase [Flavilitoribacter nigricans DSM 23189 = NBRC 102662]